MGIPGPEGGVGPDSEPRACAAGVYDHWLGGKDNLGIDRQVGDAVAALVPGAVATARANRRFLVRAVRHLAGRGVRQFLDVGTGYPTSPNVHEVAQRVVPDARVVYVDNDAVVAAHGRAVLAQDDHTLMIDGDARDPLGIVQHPQVERLLDWSQPVAVLLVAVLHFVSDDEDPAKSVAAFREIMTPGSAVVVSHATPGPPDRAADVREAVAVYRRSAGPVFPRDPAVVAGFLDGFEVMPPGLVPVDRWQVPGERDWWGDAHWSKHRRAAPGEVLHAVAGVGRVPS